MKKQSSPFKCHLFVCTNTRESGQQSCGDGGAAAIIKADIKAEIKNRGWKGLVRVSESGCLGVCEEGPNIMMYPQGIWLSGVASDDLPSIIQRVEHTLETGDHGPKTKD